MKILKGANCGFCFGVKNAVDCALSLTNKENVYILGEIIHNQIVNDRLKDASIKIVENLNNLVFTKNDTILIRAHGEPKATFDKLYEFGAKIIDCTCLFVKKIHNIVKEHHDKGYKIVIIGDEKHPEVVGINGWCDNSALITTNSDEILKLNDEKICIVVQTTFNEQKYKEIIKKIKFTDVKIVDIFKTICYTTNKRQKEAEYLSKICDAVMVIGGYNSNNTNKLFEICKENCKNVFRVVNALDFDYDKLKIFNKVGIVLGSSTPIEQFQEVVSSMEKITEEIVTTETVNSEDLKVEKVAKATKKVSGKSEMEVAFDNIKPSKDYRIGQVVTAKISSAKEDGITISLKNIKNDFELSKDEILGEYDKEIFKDKIGTEITVMVVGKNPLKFSEKAMEKIRKEEAEMEEIKNGKIFEITVTATNKGGLVGKYRNFEVFVPSSQIRIGFVKDLEKYVGKTLRLKADKVESKGARRQIVGSQRVILEAEKAERDAIKEAKEKEFFDAVEEGDIVIGTPVRFAAFGAFVEVNGFDCLAHISDLSWNGCKNCAEVLELNKEYEFKVLKLDQENKKVSIGYKQLQPRPWDNVVAKIQVGDVITGKVVRLVNFGAFVEIEKGVDGLIHVSQISNEWLENPVSALQIGQEVTVKVMDINLEKEKINLSIKALLPEVEKPAKEEDKKASKGKKAVVESEDVELREWKDDSSSAVSIAELLNNK